MPSRAPHGNADTKRVRVSSNRPCASPCGERCASVNITAFKSKISHMELKRVLIFRRKGGAEFDRGGPGDGWHGVAARRASTEPCSMEFEPRRAVLVVGGVLVGAVTVSGDFPAMPKEM